MSAVARMERSVIRERRCSVAFAPDCAALHPGYEEERKEGDGTPRDASSRAAPRGTNVTARPRFGRGAAPTGAARLSAFHRGSRRSVVTFRLSSRPGFLGRGGSTQSYGPPTGAKIAGRVTGVIRARLSQSRGSTPHTGRSTGAHDAQSRPGVGGKPARRHRTRSDRPACRPDGVLESEN